ncbi:MULTISPECIES: DUF4232 domain-containing protein [unclassified Streptomyces]|uniref:DUF4232 domain-containing protein n=1 Tax=unclassified Streptomyces TaxID=2593676 RepID=UPI00382AFC1B
MRIRRTRHLLALTALTTLALTACENGTGVKDEGASHPASSSASAQPTKPGTTSGSTSGSASGSTSGSTSGSDSKPAGTSADPAKDTAGSTGGGTGKSTSTGGGNGGTAARVLCNGSNTKVTAQPVTRPLNHMLLTVTNTGSRTCDLTYYPVLRFDEMQWVPQGAKETQPQAVTTLAPGESGYAGVLLSAADGSGDGGLTARKLTVAFQGYTPNSDGGASATPPLPAKGVYYDSSLAVTYWQRDMDDALSW